MMRASRILVVEDDATLRQIIGEVLTDEGHAVKLAGDGREALAQLAQWNPEIVVLDVMMPEMDAYQFREAQRARGWPDGTQVLVLSAVPDVETAAADLGADAWLSKPFTLRDFTAAVGDLIDRRPVA
jgi:two-component system, OmpR family, response regulator MprA